MSLFYILAAILMFGIMITVHEAGHFFAARLNRIPVREFAIGFGPKLIAWKSKKHETDFSLRAIPMGGFCAFYGEDDSSEEAKADPAYFGNFSAWRRLTTILAGPVMNLLLAFLVAIGSYMLSGVPHITGPSVTTVASVNAESPAALGGLRPLDVILSINGLEVTDNVTQVITQQAGTDGQLLRMVIDRPGEGRKQVEVTPLYSQQNNRFMIGANLSTRTPTEWVRGNAGQTLRAAWDMCVDAGGAILTALRNLVFRGEGFNEMTGMVGITQTIVQTTQQAKLQGYLFLMCLISINLGLFNLLPIPALDGSRILFLLVEAVRGKPFKREGYVHAIGMLVLVALMIWINIRDILRLF